jgi:CBS domain-containing protein
MAQPSQQPDDREAMTGGVKPSQPLKAQAGPTGSAGPAMGETSDPNFTAASRDRDDALKDAGVTRMDTGKGLSGIPPESVKSRHPLTVSELMTADVAVCEPGTSLYYVARMMEERDCGAIPVVESTDSMRPIGIVTDRDIVVRGVAKNQDALNLNASDVMSVDLVCVFPDMSLDDCLFKMEQTQVRRAVVVDHTGRCCGIIAQADIARATDRDQAGELLKDVSQPNPQQSSQHYH